VSDPKYRVARSELIVTKPTGEVVRRPVLLFHDHELDTFGILLIGEDSALRGYSFEVLNREMARAKELGVVSDQLPRV